MSPFGARPQGRGLVDGLVLVGRHLLLGFLVPLFALHHDGLDDVVGVLADDGLQLPGREQVVLAFAQVQGDLGAARRTLGHFDAEFARAFGFPQHALRGLDPGAAGAHRDLVGDDEAGVEADAELADQAGVLLLVAGKLGEKFARAGLGDGPEVSDHFLAGHSHAVVGDGQRLRFGVEGDADPEVGIALEQGGVVQGFEAQLVAGVGSVGNQLAQEDLAVGIQRVDHQLQELLDLGLEAEGFLGGGGGGHWVPLKDKTYRRDMGPAKPVSRGWGCGFAVPPAPTLGLAGRPASGLAHAGDAAGLLDVAEGEQFEHPIARSAVAFAEVADDEAHVGNHLMLGEKIAHEMDHRPVLLGELDVFQARQLMRQAFAPFRRIEQVTLIVDRRRFRHRLHSRPRSMVRIWCR
jgi:hypothetical protein